MQFRRPENLGMRTSTTKASELIVHWWLFFLICFGLGYPAVGRFDPRLVSPDAIEYYKLVAGRPLDATDLLRYRLLVPWVAKPFAWISQGHIGSWHAVPFGLLVSNSIFTATGALLLLLMGRRILGRQVALAGTLLYFLDFTVPNRRTGIRPGGFGRGLLHVGSLLGALPEEILPPADNRPPGCAG